jgi:hypothetical protein
MLILTAGAMGGHRPRATGGLSGSGGVARATVAAEYAARFTAERPHHAGDYLVVEVAFFPEAGADAIGNRRVPLRLNRNASWPSRRAWWRGRSGIRVGSSIAVCRWAEASGRVEW